MTDLFFTNHNGIFLMHGKTDAGRDFMQENFAGREDVQWFAGAVAVEPRYVVNIMTGALNEGLTVGVRD